MRDRPNECRLVRKHRVELRLIRDIGDRALVELALARPSLAREDMPAKGMIPNDLPSARALETLGRTFMCFQLRHEGTKLPRGIYNLTIVTKNRRIAAVKSEGSDRYCNLTLALNCRGYRTPSSSLISGQPTGIPRQ